MCIRISSPHVATAEVSFRMVIKKKKAMWDMKDAHSIKSLGKRKSKPQ